MSARHGLRGLETQGAGVDYADGVVGGGGGGVKEVVRGRPTK